MSKVPTHFSCPLPACVERFCSEGRMDYTGDGGATCPTFYWKNFLLFSDYPDVADREVKQDWRFAVFETDEEGNIIDDLIFQTNDERELERFLEKHS